MTLAVVRAASLAVGVGTDLFLNISLVVVVLV